ncbi:hypothetical protein FRC11_011886 [Ceratobasidium sp. 423]|nr:hypothetical protein FRC11_011886 [Ceratobasidium sp. 423]
MLFRAPRRPCWEVVDHKEVKPTPVYYDQEDLQILKIHDSDIAGQYEFEMRSDFRCRQALEAARLELLHQIKKDQCNVLLVEGWKLTKLRRGREMRIRDALREQWATLGNGIPPLSRCSNSIRPASS